MGKKRVSVTLDSKVIEAIEKMRSKEKYKPSLSSVVNALLESNMEVKKNL